jgi:hypothetical protein
MVSIDIDPSEDPDQLRRFAERYGFGWRFAMAPKDLLVDFEKAFGTQFLTPPNEPMFMVDAKVTARLVPYGHRDASALRAYVEKYRSG